MQTNISSSRIARIAAAALIVLSCFCLVAVSQPENAYASDTKLSTDAAKKLVKKGTLTVLISPDYPPFENLENGKYVGYDVDVIKTVAKRLGLKVKFKSMQFDAIMPAIAAGKKGDVAISGMSASPERNKEALASRSYFVDKVSLVVAKGSKYTSAKSLNKKGAKIAVQSWSIGEAYAMETLPKAQMLTYTSDKDCLRAVKKGTADACVVSHYALSGKKGFKKIKSVTTDKYVIYLNKSNKKLKADINKVLAKMEKDGTFKKLRKKYWG